MALHQQSNQMMDFRMSTLPPFHVQQTRAFVHYDRVSDLWNKKWKYPCSKAIYPFMDGKLEDFEPIFNKLIQLSNDDARYLYDPDAYADPFIPVVADLMAKAAEAEAAGNTEKAKELYLRAGAVCRISRFPIVRSEKSALAWKLNKEAYEKGGKYLDPPNQAVAFPFTHANTAAGDTMNTIQTYLRVPAGEAPKTGWPILLFICGLDAYRTDNTTRTQAHVDSGLAVISFEIPGTGDCPASRSDPSSPDRIMSCIIDWVHTNASTYNFDTNKICARGISTGGYYALRAGHTHGERLFAVAAQGGGAHYMFHSSWIGDQNKMEYPFALAEALACKFGHGSGDVAAYIASKPMEKYGLLREEIIGKESCKMLIINGMEDSIFPIEDSILVAIAGRNKELIVRANLGHMGNPGGEELVVKWLADAIRE